LPYIIRKEEKFYTIERHVKKYDLDNPEFNFKPYEKELVEIIEKYSDENLLRRFSRAGNVSEFYSNLKTDYFEKQVTPFIEKNMFRVASVLMLSPVRVFNKQVKYSNLYDEDEIKVQSLFARPVYYFTRTETETRYRLKVFLNDNEIPLKNRNIKVITNNPCQILHRNSLIAFETMNAKKLMPFFEKDEISVPNSIEDKYYPGFIRKTIRNFDVKAEGFEIEENVTEKLAVLSLEYNLKSEPCLILRFRYNGEEFLPNDKKEVAVQFKKENGTYVFRKIRRDFAWEKSVQTKVEKSGLIEKAGYYSLSGIANLETNNALYFLIEWINKHKTELLQKGIELEQDKLEQNYFTGGQHLKLKVKTTDDWFDVYAMVQFGEYRIPFIKLKNHILNGIREFELPNGEIAILPEEWFARYKSLMPFAKGNDEKMQFGKYHYALLGKVMDPSNKTEIEKFSELQKNRKKATVPAGLKATLRDYQKEGYQWMDGLHQSGFGGCLADDMGLGKTLQTLAILLKYKRPKSEVKIPFSPVGGGQLALFGFKESQGKEEVQPASLIVLPTSLVHNWEAEIRKFTPSLKVYKHMGQQRKKAHEIGRMLQFYDVILTTYGTVRNDADFLAKRSFYYLILDESQYVKNPSSKTYKSILKLKSEFRLVLTGTPIENSLSDLWSQMNFLNKGMLGNLAFFRRYFITPIEKHNNQEAQEKLQELIWPFILRRTKEEVAKDLPPLMEQVIYCEMAENQQKTYEREKSIIRNSILDNIEENGVNKSSMIVLQGLTKLRQLANHPKLLGDEKEMESGKFEEIFLMLENLVAENHKVLIFSSFVKHLELLKAQIEQNNWKYSLLTGQTSQREKVISQFQNEPDNRIFLISLKAGGVGLNLTGADYVFIIDPWWNPAAENQAISRAHRIGQNKNVFVYRFITENSIEEKIQKLQGRKSSLADKFINSNNPLKEISKEEILSLLE
jgi:SNF2 family DNA or RNA helicase